MQSLCPSILSLKNQVIDLKFSEKNGSEQTAQEDEYDSCLHCLQISSGPWFWCIMPEQKLIQFYKNTGYLKWENLLSECQIGINSRILEAFE